MSNNIIELKTAKRQVSQKDLYDESKPKYFSLEDDEFTYMKFGNVSIILGKDKFKRRFTVLKN